MMGRCSAAFGGRDTVMNEVLFIDHLRLSNVN
jgi:hypothetical protein